MILEQNNPSFILQKFINLDICDNLVTEFEKEFEYAKYDKFRGYYRLNNKNISDTIVYKYLEELEKCTKAYKKEYPWCHIKNSNWKTTLPFNIQKYNPNDYYSSAHIEEHGPTKNKLLRHLTFMTYLNDVKEGGETEFISQKILIKPKKGLTVIWPAGWTHPHRGHPAKNEYKYIITGWYSYFHRC